ncbi:MAG: WYL domain-containing protein, partial [Acidimicrobiia bacterium]|nr:WYL domain-containing protein [Acidimicrobiia bacterium]
SSDGLLSVPGTEPDGALARALHKLGSSLGVGSDDTLDVHLGDAEALVLDQLRRAAAEGTEVDITYYSYGRDERGARTVTPWRVFAEAGAWYLHAWCSQAEGERVFRVDRIEHLEARGTPSAHLGPGAGGEGDGATAVAVFQPRHDDPRVRLRLSPEAAWVVDAYPAEVLERGDDGHLLAELVVTAVPWLERLLLRLGPEAEVVGEEGLPEAGELAARAANRILQRYRLG